MKNKFNTLAWQGVGMCLCDYQENKPEVTKFE